MKRVLYFFPDNPYGSQSGNRTWAIRLLAYFRERNIEVHLVSTRYWSNDWDHQSLDQLQQEQLVSQIHFLNRKPSKANILSYLLKYKIPFLLRNLLVPKGVLSDEVTRQMKKEFRAILKQYPFDYIVISYALWANLIKDETGFGNTKTIIDTHDFLTSIYQRTKGFKLGRSFEAEIERLRLFDEVWAISKDEQYLFGQFCHGAKVRFITMNYDRSYEGKLSEADCQFDLIYVASDNEANKRSAGWFFEEVFPLLSKGVTICVIGKICNYVPDDIRISKIPFAASLLPYYQASRIAICPILFGTGIKIKVVEAMAHGLPIVGTERALDGLPNKLNNGCLVSNDPALLAGHISALLSDEDLYKQLSEQAIGLYELCFSKEVGYSKLDEVFMTTSI